MNGKMIEEALFAAGDYFGGALLGGITAAVVRGLVGPGTDMVVAMLYGMGIGMVVHLAIGLALTPLLGMFHAMIPGSLIGMYGGMFFGMRDSMQTHASSLHHAIGVGVAFGIVTIASIKLYDCALRSTTTKPTP
ncbi:MAG: hypothetical protein HY899_18740 [Deltaproteobacteria bacterium]|nr:hypothetical protein [Deltaproteobacteria bacterium]